MEKVKPIKLSEGQTIKDLVSQMKHAGFGARKIGLASEIVNKMFSDSECKVFFGLAGAMVPAGMKQIVIDLIRGKKIDVLVTTGANLTHDLAEALGEEHYHCDEWDDDKLHELGYDRMFNVLMKNEVYIKLENFFEKNWEKLNKAGTIKEFLYLAGSVLAEEKVVNDSILMACYENDVKLFCPALANSGIGLMIWGRKVAGKNIEIDAFEDMKEIIDLAWTSKKSGVVYVCGGEPKNFIQQSLQFSKGADYGVQITTDTPAGGGSSGAPLEEGKSWGKLKKEATFVDVCCDATIAMPLIFGSLK
ncbi:deoxyhypusine synthase family protein, partial [Candidatus Pacearchaeota archaeon]|nr:deoxyhypusine synthase family protein [Candidatus Pacearchaeota archaeon]